ncbi:MAG: hypothetical protein FWG08_02625 [Propionibacteriaceae bacterium]|nr:hypothetical protein [Propionibacteriaceae bacterium]
MTEQTPKKRPRWTIGITVVALIMAATVIRITTLPGCWDGWPKGDPAPYDPTVVPNFVQQCELEPADTYMINLVQFLQEKQPTRKNPTQIHHMLERWREKHGAATTFMTHNPSLIQAPTSYGNLHHLNFGVNLDLSDDESQQGEVYIDFHTKTMLIGTKDRGLLYSANDAPTRPVSTETLHELDQLLSQWLPTWSHTDYRQPPSDWPEPPIDYWILSVCFDDHTIYRLYPKSRSNTPEGFLDFVHAFQIILDIDFLNA